MLWNISRISLADSWGAIKKVQSLRCFFFMFHSIKVDYNNCDGGSGTYELIRIE